MNDDQSAVVEAVIAAIRMSPATSHFFLEGAGVTGTTFLYRALCSYYRSRDYGQIQEEQIQKYVVCFASTGIAGLLLLAGQTAHSFFVILLNSTLGSKLKANHEQAKLL
jgi:hypothetical protein